LSQISLPWQRGLVAVEFAWRHSIARHQKPPAIRKDLVDISCISRIIADFVANFVAMATGVGRSRICLASCSSPTPKTPCYTQRSRQYLLYKASYSRFCPKFRCHGNGVGRSRICLASCYSPTPKTPCYTRRSPVYLLYKPSYSRLCPKFRCHGNGGWSQ